jgi:hypothetical protein
MNNVIPDSILDQADAVYNALVARQDANDKEWTKASKAYAKSEYADAALGELAEKHSRINTRLSSLIGVTREALGLGLSLDDIHTDPTGVFTALATEYGQLLERIVAAVAEQDISAD